MSIDVEDEVLTFCCGFLEVGEFEVGWFDDDDDWGDGVPIDSMSKSQLKVYKNEVKAYFDYLAKNRPHGAFLVTLTNQQDKILGGFFSRTLGFTKVVSGLYNGNSGNKVNMFIKPNPKHKAKNKKAKINRIKF